MSQTDVLMACYNGEKYIRQQIDSILNQTYKDWRLLISDDGSTDGTTDIIDEYCAAHPDKIVRLRSGRRFGNAREHFFWLMSQSQADYMFFADQDDVWLPKKMELSIEAMKTVDSKISVLPVLVFSDLVVTDDDLNIVNNSLSEIQQQQPEIEDYRELLFQNVVTGNTMLINRSLADKALKCIDVGAISMHDWWIGIVAARFGKTCFIQQATVMYRQHNDNSVGAQNTKGLRFLTRKLKNRNAVRASVDKKAKQVGVFCKTFIQELNADERQFLQAFSQRKLGMFVKLSCMKWIHSHLRKISFFFLW